MTPALRFGKAGFVISFQNYFVIIIYVQLNPALSKISVQCKSSKLDKQEEER